MKREILNNTHGLKGQYNLAQGNALEMPVASNVYRKTDVGIGSTPSGSYVFHLNIFYKHTNPLGL